MALVSALGPAVRTEAQEAPASWRVTADVGGTFGGTWLKGSTIPTVATDGGGTIGLGAVHALSPFLSVGASAHIGAQSVSIKDQGAQWSGGTLTETELMAQFAITAAEGTFLRPALEFGAGAAALSGARSVLPFRDASSIAPIGEIGISLRRANLEVGSQDLAIFVHYGVVRLDANASTSSTTSGWIRRLSAGLRLTR